MHIGLLFTYGYSLNTWKESGTLNREVLFYKKLAEDIVELLSPKWLRIGGYWYPRGGIPIDIFWQTCKQPNDLFIPDHLVPNYRGRG